jgi:Tol biopolymer transport system component
MTNSAIVSGLTVLVAVLIALGKEDYSSASLARAEVVASSCDSKRRAGWAEKDKDSVRINGKRVPGETTGDLRAGDLVTTNSYGSGEFCLRVDRVQCSIYSYTRARVLPPNSPRVLIQLLPSDGGDGELRCSSFSPRRSKTIETPGAKITIGDLTQHGRRTTSHGAEIDETALATRTAANVGNVFAITVTKRRTIVKVQRGATIVSRGSDTKRAVVLGRREKVVIAVGKDPQSPVAYKPSASEAKSFKTLAKSLPPATQQAPPAVSIDGPPKTPASSVRYATFSFKAETGLTLSCAVDGSDFRLCTTPVRLDGLRPGDHTFSVRATDATGNIRRTDYAWTIDNSRIAFESGRDGNAEIYVMEPDGTGQRRLTTTGAADEDPDWSPDRKRLAFHSDRDGNVEIYLMNADGSDQTRITRNPAIDRNPTWSPDGARIAFESTRDGNREIYVMAADGRDARRLTTGEAEDIDPAWSPDGSKIVFASNRDGNFQIYVMNADGTAQTRARTSSSTDFNPAWSPDGTKIAFHSDPGTGKQLFLVNADGTGARPVKSRSERNDWGPAWAPDGRHIVFYSDRDHPNPAIGTEIYVIDLANNAETRLTESGADLVPDW